MLNQLLRPQTYNSYRYLLLALVIVGLFVAGYAGGNLLNVLLQPSPSSIVTDSASPGSGAVVSPPYRVQDFTLTSHRGDAISLSDLHGQTVLMFFGYTHCPDICPTTLSDYRAVRQALGDDADDVAFVFISVDGANDTPTVLTDYLNRFDPTFIGMTGDEATLRHIGQEYGLFFERQRIDVGHQHTDDHAHEHNLDDANYFVQHTSPSFLIDRDGYLRMVFFYRTAPDIMVEGIRQIIRS